MEISRVLSCPEFLSSVEGESAPRFASLRSHLPRVAMIDIVPKIGSQLVYVNERLKPHAIESRTDGLSKQKVEDIDEILVGVAGLLRVCGSGGTPGRFCS